MLQSLLLSLLLLQWRMGRPVRGCGRLWAGSRGRNNHEAAIRGGQDLWWLLPEAASGHQHQEPLVLWVLAVPLPVPPQGPPTGEQELQESLLRWVKREKFIFCRVWESMKNNKNVFSLFSFLNILSLCSQKVIMVNYVLGLLTAFNSQFKITPNKSS